jgi:hypothetical protein
VKTQEHVRTLHDEWGKRALSLWLGDLGDVQIDARIAGESRRGDVLYTERRRGDARRRKLGVLGEIARGIVLFEFFRNPLIVATELATARAAERRQTQRRKKARGLDSFLLFCASASALRLCVNSGLWTTLQADQCSRSPPLGADLPNFAARDR